MSLVKGQSPKQRESPVPDSAGSVSNERNRKSKCCDQMTHLFVLLRPDSHDLFNGLSDFRLLQQKPTAKVAATRREARRRRVALSAQSEEKGAAVPPAD
jgi:hypothetical protein